MPKHPILLSGKEVEGRKPQSTIEFPASAIQTTINGKPYSFKSGHSKTLLRLLREEGMLTGTKEGCAEGECGACTVFLDGKAVMACLVPAPRAHGAEITTVEDSPTIPNCIPYRSLCCKWRSSMWILHAGLPYVWRKVVGGKIQPDRNEIEQAITGNLCRCTGYYKIVKAIEDASK